MQKRLALALTLAAVVLVAAYLFLNRAPMELGAADPAQTISTPEATPETAAEPDNDAIAPLINNMVAGNPNSAVTLLEYASYTCPHCANFHANVYPRIKSEFIDTGLIRFELAEVYFDRYGLWASLLARCGGPERYFGIHDMLFDKQAEWVAGESPAQVVENLKTIGRLAGLEEAAMDVCLKDQAMAEAMVAHFEEGMTRDQVEGTPTFFINGVKHSNMSYEDMKALLDAELAK